MALLQKLTTLITGNEPTPRRKKALTNRDLIRLESKIGAQLFGPIPKGHRREFFCLDEHTWIWYEEWLDAATRKMVSTTTRYEIRDNGILKVQDGQPYAYVEGQELHNLVMAMHMYYDGISKHVYNRDPATGRMLHSQAH